MGILRKMGLKIRGDFCFYVIRPNTAVVVGMRMKNRQWGRIPKRIGHYIVRGIQMLERSPNYLTALETLTEPQKESLKKKLAPYVSVHTYPLDLLPQTAEFVGNYECTDEALLQVPEHIRYMDKLAVSGKNLSLPNGLLYLGQVRQGRREVLRNIYVHGNPNPEKPALPTMLTARSALRRCSQPLWLSSRRRLIFSSARTPRINSPWLSSSCRETVSFSGAALGALWRGWRKRRYTTLPKATATAQTTAHTASTGSSQQRAMPAAQSRTIWATIPGRTEVFHRHTTPTSAVTRL